MPIARVCGAALTCALAAAGAPAATWSGLGADTLASNTNNWEGGSAPSTNAAIVLDATRSLGRHVAEVHTRIAELSTTEAERRTVMAAMSDLDLRYNIAVEARRKFMAP